MTFSATFPVKVRRFLVGFLVGSIMILFLLMVHYKGTSPPSTRTPTHLAVVQIPAEVHQPETLDAFWRYQFNVTLSNQLPYDRRLPDTRPAQCRNVTYTLHQLPTATVIIPFHNEAWSVLVRTVVSVLTRTPPELLAELILVDDASDLAHLQAPLARLVRRLGGGRVRVVRRARRAGLVAARTAGAGRARGEVLVFLDAHVEVNLQWLEPLLDAIKHRPNTIAIPNVDDVDVHSLAYSRWNHLTGGGFQWTLNYQWKLPSAARLDHADPDQPPHPFPTATTIGCAMAVSRKRFFAVGGFDEGMHIWGGENLEISFRNWMCGGSLYVFPCSRVGHIFRKFLPYSFPTEFGEVNVINRNLQRVAEVWMDDYKKYYYASVQHRENLTQDEEATLARRKALRKQLACKDFSWYLRHVIPELPVPEGNPTYHGQLKSVTTQRCLYRVDQNQQFLLSHCYAYDKNNTLSLYANNTVRLAGGGCISHDSTGMRLAHEPCDVALRRGAWHFETKHALHFQRLFPAQQREGAPLGHLVFANGHGSVCLASSMETQLPYFMACNPESPGQFWYFTYEFKYEFAQQD